MGGHLEAKGGGSFCQELGKFLILASKWGGGGEEKEPKYFLNMESDLRNFILVTMK